MRDSYWNDNILNCGMKYYQCKSKLPSKSVNSVSVGNIRDVFEIFSNLFKFIKDFQMVFWQQNEGKHW